MDWLTAFLHSKAGLGALGGFVIAAAVDVDALRVAVKAQGVSGIGAFFDHFSIRAAARRWVIGIALGLAGGLGAGSLS